MAPKLGLGQYAPRFAENDITFVILPDLTDHDLEKIGVASLGHRRQLLRAIGELQGAPEPSTVAAAPVAPHDTAERRQVTVMFSDLVGSTALSARIEFQIALAYALMSTKGMAATETMAALEQARLFIEQTEALGEPVGNPQQLLVLNGFWLANHVAFNGDALRELAARFLALAEMQGAIIPLIRGHRLMGVSLRWLLKMTTACPARYAGTHCWVI
jgi:SAM domain (Sterile alpha motif)